MSDVVTALDFRELHTPAQMEDVSRLFDGIWHTGPDRPQIDPVLLTAMAHAGNYVVGVYDGDALVAASVGFFAAPAGNVLHSHIAGVRPGMAGKGVGMALKLHQRQWCLDRTVGEITWTFDPLVSRNAYFNLVKLGVRAAEYLVDFYGAMHDGVNAGAPSDRILARWSLLTPEPHASGGLYCYDPVLQALPDGSAVHSRSDSGRVSVGLPLDIEALRSSDPETARRWRLELRAELAPRLADGWRITGFNKSGHYLLDRD